MRKGRYVVIYDIKNTRNRTRLARLLCEFGKRTQLSVFEVDVEKRKFNRFRRLLKNRIKNYNDKIYVYPLDKKDIDKIIRLGKSESYLLGDFFI